MALAAKVALSTAMIASATSESGVWRMLASTLRRWGVHGASKSPFVPLSTVLPPPSLVQISSSPLPSVHSLWFLPRGAGLVHATGAGFTGCGWSGLGAWGWVQLGAVAWLWPAETEDERQQRLERREQRRAERQRVREQTHRERLERKRLLAEQRERVRHERHQARLAELERRDLARKIELERREKVRREQEEREESKEPEGAFILKGGEEEMQQQEQQEQQEEQAQQEQQIQQEQEQELQKIPQFQLVSTMTPQQEQKILSEEMNPPKFVVKPKPRNMWSRILFNVLAGVLIIMAIIIYQDGFELPKV